MWQQYCQRLGGLCFFPDELEASGFVQVPCLDSDGNLAVEIYSCKLKFISMDFASLPYSVILTELSSAVEYEYNEGYLLSITLIPAVCF